MFSDENTIEYRLTIFANGFFVTLWPYRPAAVPSIETAAMDFVGSDALRNQSPVHFVPLAHFWQRSCQVLRLKAASCEWEFRNHRAIQ